MDRVINIKVNGSYVTKDNKIAGVQGEANSTYLRITFDATWQPYAKKITWLNAKGQQATEITLGVDLLEDITQSTLVYLAPIPGEALTEAGYCSFIIDGYTGDVRQRSVSDEMEVLAAATPDTTPQQLTPTQAEQLQAEIDGMIGKIAEHATSAGDSAQQAVSSAIAANESRVGAASAASAAAASAVDALIYSNTCAKSEEMVAELVGAAQAEAEAAKQWAATAAAEADRATIPAVEGVYNVILNDRTTGGKYALIVTGGKLSLLGVADSFKATDMVLIDANTGIGYELIVESGELILKEVQR